MTVVKCTADDIDKLAQFNKQLIEDEKSDNTMMLPELRERMKNLLETDYNAYFFRIDSEMSGYALVSVSLR